ncbi:hypothetical protein [Hymenobacter sp. GOD-10R]|uniref:hypothetical protein n=1 Tax=Hymenobacter sp. GOD-10R TaxID=3093922 RepID=UPI002D76FB62|nr:hypothetical protein [Hymenobacter sp. GOD-10R]WRQ29748.1 hypothetical protein SD425_05655 [Hymenobacter sp. GOD-10R]
MISDFARFSTQPLLVVLREEAKDAGSLRRAAKDPQEATLYRADIAATNDALREAVKTWHLSKEVQFITVEQEKTYYNDKKASHTILSFGSTFTAPALMLTVQGKPDKLSFGNSLYSLSPDASPDDPQSRIAAATYFMPNPHHYWSQAYSTSDMISALQQLQLFVDARIHQQKKKDLEATELKRINHSNAILTKKTLLLDRSRLAPNLPETKISSLYPYPVQVVDRATIEAAVASADPQYLYARCITVYKNHGYQLVEAATGQVVAYAEYNLMRDIALGEIQDWTLKDFVKTATAKK